MKLSEFYSSIGQDYNEVLDRMLGKEELLLKFLKKYLTDPSYDGFENAVKTGDVNLIFRAAHTLKGVSANLGLKPIVDIISPLVETTRNGGTDGLQECFESVSSIHFELLKKIEEVE